MPYMCKTQLVVFWAILVPKGGSEYKSLKNSCVFGLARAFLNVKLASHFKSTNSSNEQKSSLMLFRQILFKAELNTKQRNSICELPHDLSNKSGNVSLVTIKNTRIFPKLHEDTFNAQLLLQKSFFWSQRLKIHKNKY